MSNVHEAISQHSNNQHQHIQSFLKLEAKRESLIEEAIFLCVNSKPFEVEQINQVTSEMNKLASEGIVPMRKLVTKEMVQEFVERKYGK
ncbi:YpbS family protein [Metabacillus halosaccharovorans]|uniref:YpbS family protein n=1 Tax=Metabacillus halosaccharovorans TaxID=930124 RepID=A0ABT3DN10_9BACI|nr:YpbS family protein [Metabacillus halosaccharovorans]MCV9888424.1 YpbS family protein [Metabacillus halosaccharovorans]